MAPRVVHLSDEHHAKLKSYVGELGESMTKIIEQWIDGIGRPQVMIVPKKPRLPPLNMVDTRTPKQLAEDGDLPPAPTPALLEKRRSKT